MFFELVEAILPERVVKRHIPVDSREVSYGGPVLNVLQQILVVVDRVLRDGIVHRRQTEAVDLLDNGV